MCHTLLKIADSGLDNLGKEKYFFSALYREEKKLSPSIPKQSNYLQGVPKKFYPPPTRLW